MKAVTRILVLDRGFVVIARLKPHPKKAFWYHCRSRTIRRWGTTQGLAQLVSGPTSSTILDEAVTEDIPFRAILREIHVEGAAWKQHLSAPQKQPRTATSS